MRPGSPVKRRRSTTSAAGRDRRLAAAHTADAIAVDRDHRVGDHALAVPELAEADRPHLRLGRRASRQRRGQAQRRGQDVANGRARHAPDSTRNPRSPSRCRSASESVVPAVGVRGAASNHPVAARLGGGCHGPALRALPPSRPRRCPASRHRWSATTCCPARNARSHDGAAGARSRRGRRRTRRRRGPAPRPRRRRRPSGSLAAVVDDQRGWVAPRPTADSEHRSTTQWAPRRRRCRAPLRAAAPAAGGRRRWTVRSGRYGVSTVSAPARIAPTRGNRQFCGGVSKKYTGRSAANRVISWRGRLAACGHPTGARQSTGAGVTVPPPPA